MESRLYFLFGDVLANAMIGATAGVVATLVVAESWWMLPAMIVAMVIGMVVATVLAFAIFVPLFGAMEVMVPCMLSGMVSAMVLGMQAAHQAVPVGEAGGRGAVIGLAVLVATWLLNARLRRQSHAR